MREITLTKTDKTARITILGIEHLPEVLALQDATRTALPEPQKRFVLPQSRDYFETLLKRENGLMIGVRSNDQLIAQMVVMGPMSLRNALERKALTRNAVTLHHANPDDMIVLAKSMAVHPDWRGNDLAQMMLESVLTLPLVRAADHMMAQISSENVRSWELFLKQGFGIVAAVVDPVDLQPRFLMQRPAFGFALHHDASAIDLNPSSDFVAISRLTEHEALVGRLDPQGDFLLVFHAGIDTATAWLDEPELNHAQAS